MTHENKAPAGGTRHDEADSHGLIRKLLGDAMRYLPAGIVPAAIGVVGVSVFTRIFAAEQYGRYAVILATVTLVSAVLSGWIRQSGLRYHSRFEAADRRSEFIMKLFVTLVGFIIAVLVVAAVAYPIIRGRLGMYVPYYLPAVVLVTVETVFLSFNTLFIADLRSGEYSSHKIANSALRLVLALLFVFAVRRDIMGLVVGAAAGHLILIVPMARRLGIWRRIRSIFTYVDRDFLRMFAAYGLPMVGWTIGSQILGISDRFIIEWFRGSDEVGIYAANYNLVAVGFGLVSTPILIACQPLIFNVWEHGEKEAVPRVMTTFTRYYWLAVAPVVVLIAIFSREIVSVLLGAEFREGHRIVPFVLGGVTAWGIAALGHKGLEVVEKTGVMLVLVAVCAVLNVILNLYAVPRYGYVGAAVTTWMSYSLYPILVFFATKPHIEWRLPWMAMARSSFAAVATGAVFVLARETIFASWAPAAQVAVAAIAGAPLYLGLLLLLRELRVRDFRT